MSIEIFDGFSGKPAGELACADGGGRIDCYALFDGVTAMRLRLETSGFAERRERRGGLEINFCANGRFESDFSPRDRVALTPGDMALSLLDGVELLLVPDAEPDYQNRDYFVRALRIDDPETPIDPAKAEFIMDQGQVKCRIVPVFGGVFTLTDA